LEECIEFPVDYTDRATVRAALALDTSAAEAILRERDAKVLEEAAERAGTDTLRDWLRRRAAERRMK
jgi:hypothetical protein